MAKVKLDVKHIKQLRDNDCGIACAKMVIDYVREMRGLDPQMSNYAEFLAEVEDTGFFADIYIGSELDEFRIYLTVFDDLLKEHGCDRILLPIK